MPWIFNDPNRYFVWIEESCFFCISHKTAKFFGDTYLLFEFYEIYNFHQKRLVWRTAFNSSKLRCILAQKTDSSVGLCQVNFNWRHLAGSLAMLLARALLS